MKVWTKNDPQALSDLPTYINIDLRCLINPTISKNLKLLEENRRECLCNLGEVKELCIFKEHEKH